MTCVSKEYEIKTKIGQEHPPSRGNPIFKYAWILNKKNKRTKLLNKVNSRS